MSQIKICFIVEVANCNNESIDEIKFEFKIAPKKTILSRNGVSASIYFYECFIIFLIYNAST